MTKTVQHIDCPKEWESLNDWDSHRELLYLSLKNTRGIVWEIGAGFGSTELIENVCKEDGRGFTSYESNNGWVSKLKSKSVLECTDYMELLCDSTYPIGLLFIDCAPGEIRKDLIEKYKEIAQVIVAHDTEESANYVYGMQPVLSSFKYRLDYAPDEKPHTTAVSNFIDVIKWI